MIFFFLTLYKKSTKYYFCLFIEKKHDTEKNHGWKCIQWAKSYRMCTFHVTVFSRAIITLTPRMGKCRQSVPHVMMDSVFADIAEPWTPLFPGGERGRAGTQESDKGWLTKPNQRSLLDGTTLTLLASHCESRCISSVTYESCDRKSKNQACHLHEARQGTGEELPSH